MMATQYRCPACGDHEHLYRDAGARWSPDAQEWMPCEPHDNTECTSCDWQGWLTDCEVTGDEAAKLAGDDPCPIHRQPLWRCPATCLEA